MKKNDLQPSIKNNFILSTLYEILCVLAPFITAPYASRVLGAANIGIYSYTGSIEMYFSLVATLGTATYGKREIARTRANKELNSKIFWEIELLSVLSSVVALIGWGIFVFFTKEYKLYYLLLTMNILSKMFDVSWFYRGLEQFKYTVTRNSAVKILGIVCLFVFVKKPEDLWIYFLFHVLFNLLGNLSMWITLPRFLVKVNPKEFKLFNHFKETLVYFIPTIATSIYTVLDKTLIGVITKDPYQNGYYEQATKLVNIVKTLCFTSLNAVLGSRTAYLFEQNKLDEVKEKISLSMNYILHMSIPCCIGLIAIAKILVPIFYGDGYLSVILILQLLSPVLIINGVSNCLGNLYYIPAGLRNRSSMFLIAGSILNLILNLLFIPHYQAIGAVIGTLIAESVISLLYFVYCNHFLEFKTILRFSIKPLVSSLLMFAFIFIIGKFNFTNSDIIKLAIQIIFGILVYFISLLIIKDDFIITIKNKVMKKIKK